VGGVFINYRGEDSDTAAVLIDRELTAQFGSDQVFLDSRSIPVGVDFAEELLGRLRACSVLLVVIGRRWLTLTDAAGARRIDDPQDWIRREIVEALANGLRVIPVLTADVRLPAKEDLPDDISGLSRHQYVPLRRRYASTDLALLVNRITDAEPELAKVAARRQSATQRRRRRRRLAYAAAAAAVLVGAIGLATVVQILGRNSPNDAGPQANHFTAASPWRLVIDNNIVGTNNGCTVTVTNTDTNVPIPSNLTNIYGKKSFQVHETGNFRWDTNNPGCFVTYQPGAGAALLPFTQSCCGDTDAFTALGKVAVQVKDFRGNGVCRFWLRNAVDGQELDSGSVHPGAAPLLLDPKGRTEVYVENPICGGISVSAG
jgi:TIR domain